ncbi:MAG: tripartite tricarboxylate transporter TctB family protein [Roseovarius sp.]
MTDRRKRDILTALLFVGLGLLTILVFIPKGVAVPGNVKQSALSPVFWPRIIAAGTVVAAIFLLVESILARRTGPSADRDDDEAAVRFNLPAASARTAILIVALAIFYWSLATLGIVVASMILSFAMMLFFGERKIWIVAALSLTIPLLLYGFFFYVAGVPIPLGIFGD